MRLAFALQSFPVSRAKGPAAALDRSETLMLRITVDDDFQAIALRLEGKLAGAWVQELRAVWSEAQALNKERLCVCLTEISGIDPSGRRLLREIHCEGGVLTGSGLLARTLIEDVTGKS